MLKAKKQIIKYNFFKKNKLKILNFKIANLDASDEIKIDKLEKTNNKVASQKASLPMN